MGEYIMDMRKRVGHIPLMQCGASIIVENEKGEILLQQRSDGGAWGYAGGSVELYEKVEDAAARELLEETGLVAEELELFGVFSGEHMRHTYPNGDQVSNVDIVFLCRKYHGALNGQQGEVEKLAFFAPDALPAPLFEPNQPAIKKWLGDQLSLKRPSPDMKQAVWEYRQEYFDHGESHINGSCGLNYYDSFEEWLKTANSIVSEKLSRENVHASTFFSVRNSDGRIIGSIQLRHSLTPGLKESGGHIGYGVRPTERRKGLGKKQLLLVLREARKLGLTQVMISCDKSNAASRNTILSCGGVLTEENVFRGVPQQIFWIAL